MQDFHVVFVARPCELRMAWMRQAILCKRLMLLQYCANLNDALVFCSNEKMICLYTAENVAYTKKASSICYWSQNGSTDLFVHASRLHRCWAKFLGYIQNRSVLIISLFNNSHNCDSSALVQSERIIIYLCHIRLGSKTLFSLKVRYLLCFISSSNLLAILKKTLIVGSLKKTADSAISLTTQI